MVLKHGHVDHAHMAFFEAGSWFCWSFLKKLLQEVELIVSLKLCQFFPKTPEMHKNKNIYYLIYLNSNFSSFRTHFFKIFSPAVREIFALRGCYIQKPVVCILICICIYIYICMDKRWKEPGMQSNPHSITGEHQDASPRRVLWLLGGVILWMDLPTGCNPVHLELVANFKDLS